jgi:hypothetical protein
MNKVMDGFPTSRADLKMDIWAIRSRLPCECEREGMITVLRRHEGAGCCHGIPMPRAADGQRQARDAETHAATRVVNAGAAEWCASHTASPDRANMRIAGFPPVGFDAWHYTPVCCRPGAQQQYPLFDYMPREAPSPA